MSWRKNVSKMLKIRNWDGKLYKVLKGNKSCHGGDFEWSLPRRGKPGDWTPIIEDVEMCKSGYHLTTHYAHWSDREDVSIYEAEGDVIEFDEYDKVVCSRARLLRLVKNPFPKNNSGDNNSGNNNSGNKNSGNRNSGNYNSGNYNSGDNNSGHWNSGNNNCGNWCSGNNNSIYLCTSSSYVIMFNKPVPENWKQKFPKWMYFKLLPEGYHTSWQKAFESSDIKGIKELLALPNFDYEIFEEITSITKKQIEEKLAK